MRRTGAFIAYNVWPVTLAVYAVFVAVLALRGLGVHLPFGTLVWTTSLSLSAFCCASMLSAWSHRIEVRWSKPPEPRLLYTRRQKWCVVALMAAYFVLSGVPLLLTFIPLLPALGVGSLSVVVGCTFIQRRAWRNAQATGPAA